MHTLYPCALYTHTHIRFHLPMHTAALHNGARCYLQYLMLYHSSSKLPSFNHSAFYILNHSTKFPFSKKHFPYKTLLILASKGSALLFFVPASSSFALFASSRTMTALSFAVKLQRCWQNLTTATSAVASGFICTAVRRTNNLPHLFERYKIETENY